MAVNPASISNKKYRQGVFKPSNPKKCINILREDVFGKPIYRSGWENRFMHYCNENENVLVWGCEVVVVNYDSQIALMEGKSRTKRRYYLDFYMELRNADGSISKKIIEVKPKAETLPPKPPKRKTAKGMARFENAKKTYVTNQDKWKHAERWAKANGMEFVIITEDDLFPKPKKLKFT
jgi:hypothetical protein